MSKLDKLGRAVSCDKNVARLQIAENKRMLVGKIDRLTDLSKELEPGWY